MENVRWPAPVELQNADGESPIVLICEHASNYIPPEYEGLGLSPEELNTHIAWDIGAAVVTRHLSTLLDAPAFLGTYSRLLVDLNRPLDIEGSIPTRSEALDIPANTGLSATERERRAERIFTPFHDQLSAHIDARVASGRNTHLLSVHSFTPTFLGRKRPWDAGVLFKGGRIFGGQVLERLAADTSLSVDHNVPYGVSREEDYALLVHGDDRNIPAILIEIRNDHLASSKGIELWAERLAAAATK